VLSPQMVVEVVVGGGWLRVSVEDGHPYRPNALQSGPGLENAPGWTGGRGLMLVRALTAEAGGSCGVQRTPAGGKVVWAALPLRPAPAPEPGERRPG